MTNDENSDGLPRRQFVRLSGVAGATALFAAAGAGRSLAASDHHPSCEPPSSAPVNFCGNYNQSIGCGSTGSGDPLWKNVMFCNTNAVTSPNAMCLTSVNQTPCYVILNGRPNTQMHNYLLSPRKRISGIECDQLLAPQMPPDYWQDAWFQAQPGKVAAVHYAATGLGINSAAARQFNQLHIHIAGILAGIKGKNSHKPNVQVQLNNAEKAGHTDANPAHWRDNVVTIDGLDQRSANLPVETRNYRVLIRSTLGGNLFDLVDDHIVKPSTAPMMKPETMAQQTIIVTPRSSGGFYLLNSSDVLSGGTDTCDFLLVYED